MSYSYGYHTVSTSELDSIVNRLSCPTEASKSWNHKYNAQDTHVRYLKQKDPKVHPCRSASPEKVTKIISRLTSPTRASWANRYDFDNQKANMDYLETKDPSVRSRTISRASSSRTSSTLSVEELPGQTHRRRSTNGQQSTNGKQSMNDQQLLMNGRQIAFSNKSTVFTEELNQIIGRVTRPTVASRGGKDLAQKKYEYIPIRRLKTLPYISGLDERYAGNRRHTCAEFADVVSRLTRPTKASRSREAPNPHSR